MGLRWPSRAGSPDDSSRSRIAAHCGCHARSRQFVLTALLASGCSDVCTKGVDVNLDQTPLPSPAAQHDPVPTVAVAVGGVSQIVATSVTTLRYYQASFEARVDGDPAVRVDRVEPPTVYVLGISSGADDVRAVDCDGATIGTVHVSALPLGRVALVPAVNPFDVPPAGSESAFAARPASYLQYGPSIIIGLFSENGDRLIDTSMSVKLPDTSQLDQWDEFEYDGPPGTYDIAFTAAGQDFSLPLVVVDHVDAVTGNNVPATIPPSGTVYVCFAGWYAGRYVSYLRWDFTIDGVASTMHDGSCVLVGTQKTSGSVDVTASAGGQSTMITLTVQ